MKAIDLKSKQFVTEWEANTFPWITSVSIETEEDGGWDATLSTTAGTYPQEIKTISTSSFKDEFGEFNSYFNTDCTTGIARNFCYANVPCSSDTLDEIFAEYYGICDTTSFEDYEEDVTPCPENLQGKNIWIINASVVLRNGKEIVMSNKSKYYKLMSEKAIFVLMASDGIIVFTPTMLRQAFCGYVRMKCKHINNENAVYQTNQNYGYELKAVIDLDKGKFFKMDIPKNVLNTH